MPELSDLLADMTPEQQLDTKARGISIGPSAAPPPDLPGLPPGMTMEQYKQIVRQNEANVRGTPTTEPSLIATALSKIAGPGGAGPAAATKPELPPAIAQMPPNPGLISNAVEALPTPTTKLEMDTRRALGEGLKLTPAGPIADVVQGAQEGGASGALEQTPFPSPPGAAVAGPIAAAGVRAARGAAKVGPSTLKEAVQIAAKDFAKGGGVAAPAIKKAATEDVSAAAPYVTNPLRVANPGVYKRPDVIAKEAAANVAPEHEALYKLFGVTRDDLYEISKQGTRPGNIEPKIWMPSKETRGSYAANAVMNPANAQRMVDTLSEAQKYPELIKGMDPWYVMDPLYQHMVKLVGPDEAKLAYQKFNASVAPFSAASNVMTELNRGTAAHMAAVQGNYPEFKQFAGVAEKDRGANFPDWLSDVKGHKVHGIQANPVERYLATGEHGYANDTVKIPLYLQASGVPQTGFQTRLPVPDAHFTRAVGMPDVRNNKGFNDYMQGPEYRQLGPWYRENVAKKLGIEAVPAQARMWGTYAPQTGVDTAIGAGKLELLSQSIWERAKKLGIDPKVLRDQVLRGQNHAELSQQLADQATA